MTCAACRRAFATQPENEIAKALHRATAEPCGCEKFKMSDQSPGLVNDDELLGLVISDPNSLLPDGSISPIMFVPLDRGGLSTLRDAAANEEFELIISELKQRSAQRGSVRYFHGVCEFKVATVRYDGEDRLVGVYDTALPGKPHHADIVGPNLHVITTASKSEQERDRRKRYKRMLELIGPSFIPARRFRNGAFMHHAR
jgi:hypothetical protein